MKALLLLAALAAITVNLIQNEKDIADWQQSMYPPKYNCSAQGIQAMIVDGLEDETIAIMCQDSF